MCTHRPVRCLALGVLNGQHTGMLRGRGWGLSMTQLSECEPSAECPGRELLQGQEVRIMSGWGPTEGCLAALSKLSKWRSWITRMLWIPSEVALIRPPLASAEAVRYLPSKEQQTLGGDVATCFFGGVTVWFHGWDVPGVGCTATLSQNCWWHCTFPLWRADSMLICSKCW
jgi:hypothetical protein